MDPSDGRFEELSRGIKVRNIADDITAGFIVAAVAIPLSMGFAIASGLRPEQGIIGGAIAGLFGAIFGGSKYNQYGPTAAFIPAIASIMSIYDQGFLVLVSLIAGFMLLLSGYLRVGRIFEKIPHSIVVGFTVGIAFTIALSQIGHVLGFKEKIGYSFIDQLSYLYRNISKISFPAILMTAFTILFCRAFEKISGMIPGPVPALVFGYFGAKTFWSGTGLVLIGDEYGNILANLIAFTPPFLSESWSLKLYLDLLYYSFTIFTIAAVESMLCGRAADRLTFNSGFLFSPNRELRGVGIINIFAPLFNGFPNAAALGRTALSIRVKGTSPLVGIAKSCFKILIAVFFASYLENIPIACIGGILWYVAWGMVKRNEIKRIVHLNNYHAFLMYYSMAAVVLFGFMIGILSAVILYGICYRLYEKKKHPITIKEAEE